jgi:ubiquinone/menaquinone biosynthesis C-methylase UbiE
MKGDRKSIQDFNRWSETYEDSWLQRILFDSVQNVLVDLVSKENIPGTILDIGCGTGRLRHKVKDRWPAFSAGTMYLHKKTMPKRI